MNKKKLFCTAALLAALLPASGMYADLVPTNIAGNELTQQSAALIDSQKLSMEGVIAEYETNKMKYEAAKKIYDEALKEAREAFAKDTNYVMPQLQRPPVPGNPVIYPEAVLRARQKFEQETATYPERLARYEEELKIFKTQTYPAYQKAQKEYDTALWEYRQERKKKPNLPEPKLERPIKPSEPARVARPNNNPQPEPGDEACVTVLRSMPEGLKIPVHFKKAAKYKLFMRYYQTEDMYANIQFRLTAPNTETVRFERIDWSMYDRNPQPYKPTSLKRPGGFVWTSIDLDVEFPGEYSIFLTNAKGLRNVPNPIFAISELWVSNDPEFNPENNPVQTEVASTVNVPEGFQPARPVTPHVSLNTVIKDPFKMMPTGYHECYPYYTDTVNALVLGATSDAISIEDSLKYGMIMQADPSGGRPERELEKKYPMTEDGTPPIGRVLDAEGVYKKDFSDSFQEYLDMYAQNAQDSAQAILESDYEPLVSMWWTAWEQCGNYDYGETSVAAFHEFLKKRYSTIDALNKVWHTEYKDFSEIFPAKHADIVGKDRIEDSFKRAQATANFIDFRDFCSKTYAEKIALKTKAVLKLDSKKRHITSNLSCNNLSSVMWLKWRPLSFEDTAQITMKGSDTIGYDMYGSDDLAGANFDLYSALGDEKLLPMVREGSTHAAGPELASRMMWLHFAKGMRGMRTFCVQESGTGELQKFGMADMLDDGSPRPKLAAYADNYRALHHLDYLLSETTRTRVDKPVAIYYSSTCNVLQEKPYASIFDCGPDNFFRVYELIRSNGYPVTFITDRQILETDRLNQVKAVFFIDASYIPTGVVDKVQKWVENGGNVIADAQVGQYDGHGFPSDKMAQFLGIQPIIKERVSDSAAANLAFGYSAYAFDVINRDELFQTASEFKNQLASTHPIAKKIGKLMVSAMGYQDVNCLAGDVLISNNNGAPAWIIREQGQGTASYFAGYLGTMYGAGCTQIEWRDSHADDAPYRMIDAYLDYIGVKKEAVSSLSQPEALAMRFESPLVDPKGNTVLGMVSYNNHKLSDFVVRYALPKTSKEPRQVFAITNSSRTLTPLKFKYNAQDHTITFKMRGFLVHGTALCIADSEPIVSVEYQNAKRDAYNLLDFRPNDEVSANVKVYNLSNDPMEAGKITLRLPEGWFYDKETVSVPAIAPHGESPSYTFQIKAPPYNMSRRLRPLNFVYTAKDRISSPAVDMAWFQKSPLNPEREVLDLE